MRLTANTKIVNAVEKRLNEATEGYCPCVANSIGNEEYKCPCVKARVDNECCCGVYEKE